MKQKVPLLLLLLVSATILQAQLPNTAKIRYLQIGVSNSHSAKPFASFSSLFHENFHPGIDIGYGSFTKAKKRHQWLLEMHLSYMFHRWVQHNAAVYGNGGYRYAVTPSWALETKVGAGYQLSFPNSKVFVISGSEGVKRKTNFGRSQLIANLGLGIRKNINPPSGACLFIEYKQQIQTPFIREYVPVLPYNILLIGVAFALSVKTQKI